MGNFFAGSWIPKVGGALSAAGTALVAFVPIPGIVMIGLGAALSGFSARQNNVSSEAAGIKAPEVVVQVEPPIVKVVQQPLMPRGGPQ